MSAVEMLQSRLADNQVLVFVGTGVSLATAQDPIAGWKGFLRHGLDYCESVCGGLSATKWKARQTAALDEGDLDELLSVAEHISRRLAGPEGGDFRGYLRSSVGALKIKDPSVIDALAALSTPLVTCNYDNLIEQVTNKRAITWREEAKTTRFFQTGEKDEVLHLHGHWEDPRSVVLGVRSYSDILAHRHVQALMTSMMLAKSVLFVGFGEGLEDPNFEALRRWVSEVMPGTEHRHYRLCLNKDLPKLDELHKHDRVTPIGFGDQHSELSAFLRSLRSSSTKPSGGSSSSSTPGGEGGRSIRGGFAMLHAEDETAHSASTAFVGRARELATMEEALRPDSPVRVVAISGMGGVGKSSLVREFFRRHGDLQGVFRITLDPTNLVAVGTLLAGVARRAGVPQDSLLSLGEHLRRERAVLVIENIDSDAAAALVADLLRELPRVRVVTTGRNVEFGLSRTQHWEKIELAPLASSVAVEILREEGVSEDVGELEELARRVGGHPLACHLASAYLRRGYDARSFLNKLRAEGFSTAPLDHADASNHDRQRAVIASSLTISRTLLRDAAGSEADLWDRSLEALAFMPLDGCGRELVAALTGLEGLPDTLSAFLRAVTALSLVRVSVLHGHRRWQMHPLVSEWLRSTSRRNEDGAIDFAFAQWIVERAGRDTDIEANLSLPLTHEIDGIETWLSSASPDALAMLIPACIAFIEENGLPHVWLAAAERAMLVPTTPKSSAGLRLCVARLLHKTRRFADALRAAAALVDLASTTSGTIATAPGKELEGDIRLDIGDRNGALCAYQAALSATPDLLHRERAVTHCKMAWLFLEAEQLSDTVRQAHHALALVEGLDDCRQETAVAKGLLADVVVFRARYPNRVSAGAPVSATELDEAQQWLEEGLAVHRGRHGIRSLSATLAKLADLALYRGRLEEALARRSEQVDLLLREGRSDRLARARQGLAMTLSARGLHGQALTLIETEVFPVFAELKEFDALAMAYVDAMKIAHHDKNPRAREFALRAFKIAQEHSLPLAQELQQLVRPTSTEAEGAHAGPSTDEDAN